MIEMKHISPFPLLPPPSRAGEVCGDQASRFLAVLREVALEIRYVHDVAKCEP